MAQHPQLHSEVHSSPLCNALLGMRRMVSADSFFLSQLDNSFEASYGHLLSGMQGFLRGWYHNCTKRAVVDKNRAWLHAIEMLLQLAPEAKLIVCVRELGQIYGSIEAQHQKTLLLDFPDGLADYDRFGRAERLFAKESAIGAPLISLHAVPDLPQAVQQRLYFLRFEDLMRQPAACMTHVFAWLGLPPHGINPEHLSVGPQESDSHYRMKYSHRQSSKITQPHRHQIAPRIQAKIETTHPWFYQQFYPDAAKGKQL